MDLNVGQDSDLFRILALDMQYLDSTRHEYETQAQEFSRRHDIVVTVVLTFSIFFILSGVWWMSIFVFLAGALVISSLKAKKLAAERQISQIDREIRQISLEILSKAGHRQNGTGSS